MAEDNIVQKIKRWETVSKGPIGRPKTSWEDDVLEAGSITCGEFFEDSAPWSYLKKKTPPSTESQISYCRIKYVSVENVTVLTAVMFSDYESTEMRQGKADMGKIGKKKKKYRAWLHHTRKYGQL